MRCVAYFAECFFVFCFFFCFLDSHTVNMGILSYLRGFEFAMMLAAEIVFVLSFVPFPSILVVDVSETSLFVSFADGTFWG